MILTVQELFVSAIRLQKQAAVRYPLHIQRIRFIDTFTIMELTIPFIVMLTIRLDIIL